MIIILTHSQAGIEQYPVAMNVQQDDEVNAFLSSGLVQKHAGIVYKSDMSREDLIKTVL